jgi:hypothetical protein
LKQPHVPAAGCESHATPELPKESRTRDLLDGRNEEVALDFYAQADDGSVWYFGEDVYNYRDGVVVSTDGTWLAGKEGPAAMGHARRRLRVKPWSARSPRSFPA